MRLLVPLVRTAVVSLLLLTACGDPAPPTSFPSPSEVVGFSPGPDLAEPRQIHASAALEDGRVLICGGFDMFDGSALHARQSCEFFDAETSTLNPGPPMTVPRLAHEMVPLPDGKVLAMGGQHLSYLSTAELLDPSEGSWKAAASMAEPRIHFTATYGHGESMVFVAGGISDIVPQTEFFLTNLEAWFPAMGPMSQPRSYHGAAALHDGRILVAGGAGELDPGTPGAEPLDSAELFDPATRTWSATGSMHEPRARHTVTLLPDGRVLVTGGSTAGGAPTSSVELYDPATGTWSEGKPMQQARIDHTATLLVGGRRVLVAGGLGVNGTYSTESELFDVETGEWSSAGMLVAPRMEHTAHLLPDGRVLLLGGTNGAPLRSTELFTPPCASHIECASGFRCAVEGVCVPDDLQSN